MFCEKTTLQFGLVQYRGGPCGLIASIQALLIKSLLARDVTGAAVLDPPESMRQGALVAALTEVVWRAATASRTSTARCVLYVHGRSLIT